MKNVRTSMTSMDSIPTTIVTAKMNINYVIPMSMLMGIMNCINKQDAAKI
jgi:hypothetical protein